MKLESLNDNRGKSPPSNPEHAKALKAVIPEDSFTLFNEGDTVMLKSTLTRYSNDLKRIAGIKLEVVSCTNKDLGDGVRADILYVKGHPLVQNPYLAEHFKRIV